MSKLNVDQKTIKELFENIKTDFLIPDYQRPYAWGEPECQTLWDDLFSFSFPDNNADLFDRDKDEYFLGPIVTFRNEDGKLEIIDGQQRLTTLMLLLRAFYCRFQNQRDQSSVKTREILSRCIWKTTEMGEPILAMLKIDSEVATDDDKEEFIKILKTGVADPKSKSVYAKNYRFFEDRISKFIEGFPSYAALLPWRILHNCILLPIEAESQETALRIFSTLNDRGKPLSDSDIFKAQLYKYYKDKGEKASFIEKWKELEKICSDAFDKVGSEAIDEIFTRYMYYRRALMKIKLSTTEGLRRFYERDGYSILKDDSVVDDLMDLAYFWKDESAQDQERFSENVLRRLSILDSSPNSMWTYFLSVYYMKNKDQEGNLEEGPLIRFLDVTTAFTFAYAVTNPGVNSLRTPVFAEMINVAEGKPVTFSENRFQRDKLRSQLENFEFFNSKPVTRSMVTWWAYQDDDQILLPARAKFDIEHIHPKRRSGELPLSEKLTECLGNKVLLEERINIRASDYRFEDKKPYYLGTREGRRKEPTMVSELRKMASLMDEFAEKEIIERNSKVFDEFISFLDKEGLIE